MELEVDFLEKKNKIGGSRGNKLLNGMLTPISMLERILMIFQMDYIYILSSDWKTQVKFPNPKKIIYFS